MPDNYIYDIFLSYKRCSPVGPWVKKSFYPNLRDWLTEANDGIPPKIFFDQDCIEWGDNWLDKLKFGLNTSRILLAVCSPSYFRSKWCRFEWESFAQREKLFEANRLRIPITHNDGSSFPEEAKALQMMDFSDCVSIMPSFPYHPKSIILEDKIKILAPALARAFHEAPSFRPDWPLVDVLGAIRIYPGHIVTEIDDDSLDGISTPFQRL